jgi:MFS family permease
LNFDALQSPLYRRFWLGSIGSIGATQLYFVTMAWLVFELSGSALDLGMLGVATAAPTIVATLAGGLVADRTNRRRVLLVTTALAGMLLAVLAVLDATNLVRVWHVLLIAAALGLISGFDLPARVSIFPALIEPNHMMSAVALNSILWQGTRMILPAIGGVLIAVTDTSLVFFLCAIGFAAMVGVLCTMEVPYHGRTSGKPLHELKESFVYIIRHRIFYVLIGLTWITMFFGTSYVQIMPLFSDLLGGDEQGYGLLISATGVGSVAGTFAVGRFQQSRHLGLIMLSGAAVAALTLICFALVTRYGTGLPGAFLIACTFAMLTGVFSSMFMISSMTVLQLQVPNLLRGRVMGIHSITFSLIALGGLVMGPLAAAYSAPIAVFCGGLTVLACVIGVMIRFPDIRHLDGRHLKDVNYIS